MSNLLILRMRFFHYKELLKIFALNYKDEKFSGARNSVMAFLVAPSLVALGFNLANPFSILRPIGIYGTFCGCFGAFLFNLKDELGVVAMRDKTEIGDMVRYRF